MALHSVVAPPYGKPERYKYLICVRITRYPRAVWDMETSPNHIKHLMTGPEGNSEFCFPRIFVSGNIEIRGKQNSLCPKGPVISDLLYSKTKQKQNLKTALRFQRTRATTVNISRVTVNCFPFDAIVFAMLPARNIWRETVSLLDVMSPWTSQWMGAL